MIQRKPVRPTGRLWILDLHPATGNSQRDSLANNPLKSGIQSTVDLISLVGCDGLLPAFDSANGRNSK